MSTRRPLATSTPVGSHPMEVDVAKWTSSGRGVDVEWTRVEFAAIFNSERLAMQSMRQEIAACFY